MREPDPVPITIPTPRIHRSQVAQYTVARYLNDDRIRVGIVTLPRDATVIQALTLMKTRRYSQIPITDKSKRQLYGTVTWNTIGAAYIQQQRMPEFVRDCMNPVQSIVDETASVFNLFDLVSENEFALVRDRNKQMVTIFTATDLSMLYDELSRQFVYLGEIEAYLRDIVRRLDFSAAEFEGYLPENSKPAHRVEDLSFGAYVRILERADNYGRTGLGYDHKYFCERLREVGEIRNAVMHFDPDGLTPEQERALKDFWQFLRGD